MNRVKNISCVGFVAAFSSIALWAMQADKTQNLESIVTAASEAQAKNEFSRQLNTIGKLSKSGLSSGTVGQPWASWTIWQAGPPMQSRAFTRGGPSQWIDVRASTFSGNRVSQVESCRKLRFRSCREPSKSTRKTRKFRWHWAEHLRSREKVIVRVTLT